MEDLKSFIANITLPQSLVVSLLIVGGYWYFVFNDGSDIQSQIGAAESKLSEVERELASFKAKVKDLEQYREVNKFLKEKFEVFKNAAPTVDPTDDASIHALEQFIVEEVKAISADLSSINVREWRPLKIKEQVQGGGYEFADIDLNIQCPFDRIILFLSNMTKSGRFFVIRSFGFSPQGASGLSGNKRMEVGFNVTFTAYRFVATQATPNTSEG